MVVRRDFVLHAGTGGQQWTTRKWTAESRSWWTTADALTEDFSLAAGRYKPQIADPAPEGNPAQLIRETLALEREIVTRLERLLKEVEE